MLNFPKDSRVIQLRELSKEPANAHGHLTGEPVEYFTPTNPNVALVLGTDQETQFVVLDIDYPSDPSAKDLTLLAEKAPTRRVETPHGVQYVWLSPEGLPRLRAPLDGKEGTFGELLSQGYVVGPGSRVDCNGKKHRDGTRCGIKEYRITCEAEPAPAPEWVVTLAAALHAKRVEAGGAKIFERSGVPAGSHDKAGADLAFNLRKWLGLDEEAIRRFFAEGGLKGVVSVLEGYNPASPFTQLDAERWARSAARKTVSSVIKLPACLTEEDDEETESFANTGFIEAPLRWWVRGFVPRGHLVALYGKGGRGKSSMGSWIVGEVTHRKSACAIFCVEESPKLFAARAIIGGADRTLLHSVKKAGEWIFPQDLNRLRALIKRLDIKFIWFDSLYSHFEHVEGKTQSTQARVILGQMEVICREEDCTILGVFHENKGGSYLGPTEMENVVRVMLHASRSLRGVASPLKVKVVKTNMPFKPDAYLRFVVDKIELHDPETGETQLEEIEPGREIPLMVPITQRIEDGLNADEEIESVLEAAAASTTTNEWREFS